MTKNTSLLSLALGAVFSAALMITPAGATDNPFASASPDKGYQVAASEGKCGGGKCGTKSGTKEAKCGEGKCGAKAMEGKCGEGKCGGTAKPKDAKCGTKSKPRDSKCGEGKCGGMK